MDAWMESGCLWLGLSGQVMGPFPATKLTKQSRQIKNVFIKARSRSCPGKQNCQPSGCPFHCQKLNLKSVIGDVAAD